MAPSSFGSQSIEPTKTRCPGFGLSSVGRKKSVSTPVGIVETWLTANSFHNVRRSSSETASTWSNERHTLASMVFVFFHSAPYIHFRKGCFSTSHLRFRNKNSTLCSNTILGWSGNCSSGTAVCRKSQKSKSKRLRWVSFSTVERKSARLHLARK